MIEYRRGPEFGKLDGGLNGAPPAIVLWNPKYPHNVGQVVRLASCYEIGQVWSCGDRVPITSHGKDYRLPREERMRGYADVTLFSCEKPLNQFHKSTTIVGVEYVDNAESLPEFIHDYSSVYVFGPEDGSLPVQARKLCWRFIKIPTKHCLNLATAVATVLYDRHVKGEANVV
jgi:tRNA(Leu) C34 or U34 (ribose-2'-O)-methylase TrmL